MTIKPVPHPELSPNYEWCVAHDHGGITYNPLLDRTWCLCGARIYDGDVASWDLITERDAMNLEKTQ